MTLDELKELVDNLHGEYGGDCPVKSFVMLAYENKSPRIWYDEDEDAVLIH